MSPKRKLLLLHLGDIHGNVIPVYFSYIDINWYFSNMFHIKYLSTENKYHTYKKTYWLRVIPQYCNNN